MTPQSASIPSSLNGSSSKAGSGLFALDMVHHNPNEEPFSAKSLDPEVLKEWGFNGQVFKHLNCAVRFDSLGDDFFPDKEGAADWMDRTRARIQDEIACARRAGLMVFYHIDLVILPRALVQKEGTAILDNEGRISTRRARTLELHRILFEEIFRDFPEVDGLIIRTGETYLSDTPHHVGNGPVDLYHGIPDLPKEQGIYSELINFLRQEICERHGRWLIYRTWDACPDRFHADSDYYLKVTERVAPHPKLIFSIKHTQLDFFRRVAFNPSLGRGAHPQVVEVQCQREYEGKGAHPNYVMNGVIEGFEEDPSRMGLRRFSREPYFRGVYSWSRGGGWYGPYLQNEFWCELHSRVLGSWLLAPDRSEEEVFMEIAGELGFDPENALRLRRLCLLSAQAVLKGRYCSVRELNLCWMRDENIGGPAQLKADFDYLDKEGLFEIALKEKAESVSIWEEMETLAGQVVSKDSTLTSYVRVSTTYGRILYSIVRCGWEILVHDWRSERGEFLEPSKLQLLLADYDQLWEEFNALSSLHPDCASIYGKDYWSWPGRPAAPGLDAEVKRLRALLPESLSDSTSPLISSASCRS